MRLPAFNRVLLPLVILLVAHALAFIWRTLPPATKPTDSNTQWQQLAPLSRSQDVRPALLAGGHWGQPVIAEVVGSEQTDTQQSPELSPEQASQQLQARLLGIVYRGEWVLLFARDPATDIAASSEAGSAAAPVPTNDVRTSGGQVDPLRPFELRAGDPLPGSQWHISRIWPDHVQLQHPQQQAILLPLYPHAESVTEP